MEKFRLKVCPATSVIHFVSAQRYVNQKHYIMHEMKLDYQTAQTPRNFFITKRFFNIIDIYKPFSVAKSRGTRSITRVELKVGLFCHKFLESPNGVDYESLLMTPDVIFKTILMSLW